MKIEENKGIIKYIRQTENCETENMRFLDVFFENINIDVCFFLYAIRCFLINFMFIHKIL